jgi:hypothetical protein
VTLLAAALALALPLAAQTPRCDTGFVPGLDLTREQWDAACLDKPPKARPKPVKAKKAAAAAAALLPAARWRVYDSLGKEVLRYRDEAGLLTSRTAGGPGVPHTFISGAALDAGSEDALRTALDASADSAGFRVRLQQAGFLVLPDDAGSPVPPGSKWEVLKGGTLVLKVKNEPGPIVSKASSSGPAANHKFLSASSYDAAEEDAVRELLNASKSTADFLRRLEKAGYTVRRAD